MNSKIEIEIQRQLVNLGDAALVADDLLKKWSRDELTLEESEAVGHFLISFGFENAFVENLALKVRDNQAFPWSPLLRLLNSKKNLNLEIIEAIAQGCSEQNQLGELAGCPDLVALSPKLKTLTDSFWTSRARSLQEKKEKLFAEVQFFQNEGLIEQERAAILDILSLDDTDSAALERWEKISNDDARQRIKRSGELLNRDEILRSLGERMTPEEQNAMKEFAERIGKKLKKRNDLKSDMALGLFLMGDSESALKILEEAPKSAARDWLRLELLLESHRFVDALSWLDHLESAYGDQSETIPACVYARAKALWGLKQCPTAISLMESLLKSYPEYRSAHALMLEWTGSKV